MKKRKLITEMTCCSLQEVCLILPDAQGNDNKNHPADLVACKNQSELVNASMAWESACPSCVKLGTLLQYSHVREQEGLQRCSAILFNIRSDWNRSFSSSFLSLMDAAVISASLSATVRLFGFSHSRKYKSCQGFLCTGPCQG